MNNVQQRFVLIVVLTATMVGVPARCSDPVRSSYRIEGTRVEYCAGDRDLAVARIHFSLRFLNRSKTNMILSRLFYPRLDIKIIDPSGARVWPTSEYELAHGEPGATPDDTRFEIIKPTESTLRDFVVRVFVSRDLAHPVRSVSVGGTYLISAALSTWPFYGDIQRARHTRTLWKPYGTLVMSDVVIKNLRVEISIPENLDACGQTR